MKTLEKDEYIAELFRVIDDEFRFLVTDFGFRRRSEFYCGRRESSISFVSNNVEVIPQIEGGNLSVIIVDKNEPGRRRRRPIIGLNRIIRFRCPDQQLTPSEFFDQPQSRFRPVFRFYAQFLRTHAADVLNGDFSKIPEF